MRNIREIINTLTESDFADQKADLHIHTNYSDGTGDCMEILNSAKDKGYKYIAITDHNTLEAHEKYKDEILITGAEFDCWFGYVFIHLLAYGIDVNNEALLPFLAKNKRDTEDVILRLIPRRNVKKLISAIHLAGGVAVLAHPACYWALNLERLVKKLMKIGLDGIEVYYPYPRFRRFVKFHSAQDVKKIAEKYPELLKTGGSDFHGEKL